jgi:hypothetical protein
MRDIRIFGLPLKIKANESRGSRKEIRMLLHDAFSAGG